MVSARVRRAIDRGKDEDARGENDQIKSRRGFLRLPPVRSFARAVRERLAIDSGTGTLPARRRGKESLATVDERREVSKSQTRGRARTFVVPLRRGGVGLALRARVEGVRGEPPPQFAAAARAAPSRQRLFDALRSIVATVGGVYDPRFANPALSPRSRARRTDARTNPKLAHSKGRVTNERERDHRPPGRSLDDLRKIESRSDRSSRTVPTRPNASRPPPSRTPRADARSA